MKRSDPRVRFDPELLEAVVDLLVRRRADAGDGEPFRRFRRAADRIYVLYDTPKERQEAFRSLHARLFDEMGCGRAVIEEARVLIGWVQEVVVARAWRADEEGADLSADRRLVGVRIQPGRFISSTGLQSFLRHEFGHISDMVDEAFLYGDGAASGRLPRLAGARFGSLWDCVVDGRIARAGGVPLHSREDLEEECARLFPVLPPDGVAAIVRRLWEGERPTYASLVRWATDPAALAAWAGLTLAAEDPRGTPPPGAPCPLCGFATYAWAPEIDPVIAAAIQADVPEWQPADGVCARCVEAYVAPRGA